MQMVELLFRREPTYDFAAIKSRTEGLLGIEIDGRGGKQAFSLFYIEHRPANTAFLTSDRPTQEGDYGPEIQQSWSCPDADQHVAATTHSCLLTEMMAGGVPATERVRLFHAALQAAVEHTEPSALIFKHSQQVVDPQVYLETCDNAPMLRPGSLNVRMFNIEGTDDMLMDTRGLHELGIGDLQCHFHQLDPNSVSRVLLNTGIYLFENGPVIKSGHTISGTHPESMWMCQLEQALMQPEREVLDLNPGEPYAAGDRA